MVYRRTIVRKRTALKKKKTTTTLATKAWVKKVVQRAPELKFHVDYNAAATTMAIGQMYTNHFLVNLNNGSLTGERVGSRIRLKYIDLYHRVVNINDSEPVYFRYAVLIDRHSNKNFVTDTFETQNSSLNDPVDFVGTGKTDQIWMKWDPTRFQVLYERRLMLSDPVNHSNHPAVGIINKRLYVNKVFKFIDNDPDIDTLCTPAIFTVWFIEGLNDNTSTTALLPNSYKTVAHFTDE